jgi:hypothetical protein
VRIVVAGEQISFFERYGYVELESFFTERTTSLLLTAAEEEIARREELSSTNRGKENFLLHGYDLALSSERLRKELFSRKLGMAAYYLCRRKPLRYAFDCLWKIPSVALSSPIDTISSVTPLMLSAVIALTGQLDIEIPEHKPFEYTSFPQRKGSVAFISPKTVFQTADVLPGTYLLITFTSAQPVYRLQQTDPHTHFLKGYGYVFGDQLKETTHPVLFR